MDQSATPLPSPGRMDDISRSATIRIEWSNGPFHSDKECFQIRESTDVLQVPTYDGFRVEYHKPICHTADKSLTYSHLLWLGPSHLQVWSLDILLL